MAGILRAGGHTVALVDANGLDLDFNAISSYIHAYKPEAVITRSTPSTFQSDIKVVKIAKMMGARTYMLNWNLSGFAEEIMRRVPELDHYITAYSYENMLNQVVESPESVEYGLVSRTGDGEILSFKEGPIKPVGDIPAPPWELVGDHSRFFTRTKAISPWGIARGSKGCNSSCLVCVECMTRLDPRTPELIVDEVEELVRKYGVKYLSFFDNTFTSDPDWANRIADGIIARKLKFKWFINTRSDCVDRETMMNLKAAGLDGVSLGVESGNDDVLKQINKGFTIEASVEAVKTIRDVGVKTYISMMMGLPGETKQQMLDTYNHILDLKPHGFQISIVIPYPHTPLYHKAVRDKLIESELIWDGMSCVPTGMEEDYVQLSTLTPSELVNLRRDFYTKLYTHPRYLIPNLTWTVTHPEDFRIALSYGVSLIRRILNKVTYSH